MFVPYAVLIQALEMQGRHSEAVVELSKICLIHQIFPPEESSVCDPVFSKFIFGILFDFLSDHDSYFFSSFSCSFPPTTYILVLPQSSGLLF